MSEPRYSIGTYDGDEDVCAYTPPHQLEKWHNLTRWELRAAMRKLRKSGYSVHRNYWDNDAAVMIERTDEKSEADVLKGWKR